MTRRFRVGCALLLGLVAACGTSGGSVQRLTGKVTFKGQPVPSGQISFLPDAAKGGSGPGGFADIKDGVYDTANKGGGVPLGPIVVRIDGFDGKTTADNRVGQPLFLNHEVRLDLAAGVTTRDFDVPASAAQNLPQGGGEAP